MRLPHGMKLRGAGLHRNRGMILLEVIVSIVILGVSVAAIMRSFTLSMSAIHKNDITTTAFVLAEGLLQELELEPPRARSMQGTFEDQGYPRYSWAIRMEEEEIRYRHLKTKGKIEDLKPLQYMKLTITYDDGVRTSFKPVQTELYLPQVERFTQKSKFFNELFKDED